MNSPTTNEPDYARQIPFNAPRDDVFDALTTLDGLGGWWTPLVTGNPTQDGQITFRFAGLDERIVMRVERATRPSSVIWTCLTHTGHPEWEDTQIVFQIEKGNGLGGMLSFRHVGLIRGLNCYEVCGNGWEHFLPSLLDYAQRGQGSPF